MARGFRGGLLASLAGSYPMRTASIPGENLPHP